MIRDCLIGQGRIGILGMDVYKHIFTDGRLGVRDALVHQLQQAQLQNGRGTLPEKGFPEEKIVGALQQHPGKLGQNQRNGLGKLTRQGIWRHQSRIKGLFRGCAQGIRQLRMGTCQIKV